MTDKATIEHAGAENRSQKGAATKATIRESSGDAFLVRVLERRLGSPLDVATTRCIGLADELKGAVAAADRLMQRIQMGAKDSGLKNWRGNVRDYARATLKAEALAAELEEQVGRTTGVVKALDDLSLHTVTSETEVASLLEQFAEFLQDGLPEGATLGVDVSGPCVVGVSRETLIGMLSNAIDSALYNMLEAGSPPGRILFRASVISATTVVVEIADEGAPAAALLQANAKDPSFSDSRAIRLRQLRKRARRAGGEMTVESTAAGNVLSLYLPLADETPTSSQSEESSQVRPRRRQRVGPRDGSSASSRKPVR